MLSSYVSLSVKVDWDADSNFDGEGEDVSADVRYPLVTRRGRSSATDGTSAGTGQFSLRNGEGTYTPFYASSPLYPNVLPGREVIVVATYNGTEYPVFRGRCTPEAGRFASDGEMMFSMIDAFEELRKGKITTELLQDLRVDEVIGQVLDDIGWDPMRRILEPSPETLAVFANEAFKEDPLTVLQRAAHQDIGGVFLIDREGNAWFQSRDHRAMQTSFITLEEQFDELVPSLRQEDLVDTVRGAYARFTVGAALSAVYTMSSTGRAIYPGTDERNTFEVTFNGVGATGTIEPIATTDYTANSSPDGSGTDKTAQLLVSSFAASSKGGVISFENLDSSPVYITALQVRGYAIDGATEDNVIELPVPSPVLTGQTLEDAFEFNENGQAVLGWVRWQTFARGQLVPRLMLRLTPDSDELMAAVLGAEIGKRVTIRDTAAPWLTQLSGDFFIEAIELTINGAGEATAVWTLFSDDMVGGSMAAISSDLDAVARKLMYVGDFATIAADDAVDGYRVGY